jgi:lysophospholipase L1-like esterase
MKGWKKGRIIGILLLTIIVGLGFLGEKGLAALQAKKDPKIFHYVALGDSLTVGYEPGMTAQSVPYGFVDRVYEQALYLGRADVHNDGIIGLTSLGLKNLLQSVNEQKSAEPAAIQPGLADPRVNEMFSDLTKWKRDIQHADLITITIGGNDFLNLVTKAQGMTAQEIQSLASVQLESYSHNLNDILSTIYQLNPTVKVAVADQYQPYPLIDPAMYKTLEEIKDQLSTRLDQTTAHFQQKKQQIYAVHLASLFVGNELKYTHIAEWDVHPNQLGYEKMAENFSKAIWGIYKTPHASTGQMGFIVNGKDVSDHSPILLIHDHAYASIREVIESLGGKVAWQAKTKSALISYNGTQEKVKANSDQMTISQKNVNLTGPVEMVHSKVYVPVRSIADGLGLDVNFREKRNTLFINP